MSVSIGGLQSQQALLQTSIIRMSTGRQINTAGDNPAGSAVANLMAGDIAQFSQRSRNLAQTKDYTQSAESSLGSVNDILKRMNTLASQAATGTTSGVGRQILDNEFQHLKSEVASITARTRSAVPQGIDKVDTGLADVDTAIAGLGGADLTSPDNAATAATALDGFQLQVSDAQAGMGAKMNVLDSAKANEDQKVENLTASYSTIMDTKFGPESTRKALAQTGLQAYIAMLAQSNANQTMKLSLFKV